MELLGQVRPLGRMGDCFFPKCAGSVCERPLGQDQGRAEHGEGPEYSRELVTAWSGIIPGLSSGTQKDPRYWDHLHTVVGVPASAEHHTESKP